MKISNTIYLAITLATMTLMSACGHKNIQQDEHAAHQHKATQASSPTEIQEVSLKNDGLNAVYQQYLVLSNALIAADLITAKEASLAIETGAKKLDNGIKMAELAAKITTAHDVEAQRELFVNLSEEMIKQVKVSGLNAGEVYIKHCPMVANNKGASWLSNQKEIRNPYYGASMMDCGSVKETLK